MTPLGERLLEIERADDTVLRRAERQVDDRHGHAMGRQWRGEAPVPALEAERGFVRRIAAEAAADDSGHARQKRGQAAHGGRLAAAAIPQNQDAADGGIDGGDQDAKLHLGLADDGGKGISHEPLLSPRRQLRVTLLHSVRRDKPPSPQSGPLFSRRTAHPLLG